MQDLAPIMQDLTNQPGNGDLPLLVTDAALMVRLLRVMPSRSNLHELGCLAIPSGKPWFVPYTGNAGMQDLTLIAADLRRRQKRI